MADNGVGILPENLTRIFSHGFTTRKHGHGFGLHSGANAAKEMGGKLTAHSEGPGKGAIFILELPLEEQANGTQLNSMEQSKALNKNRILIIDDNPSIHEDIRKILAAPKEGHDKLAQTKALLFGQESVSSDQEGFEIESAFQGQEGLHKVQQAEEAGQPFALAFVDVRMPPGWDGVETINRIWQNHPRLQVVICTAYADYSWEEMIRCIGKSDSLVILKKPFDNIEVKQLAHALTEKWRLSNEVNGRLKNLDLLVSERTVELQSANERLKREIEERMLLDDALRLSEERFSKAFKASPIPLAIQSLKKEEYVDVNPCFVQLTGYDRDEIIGHTPHELNIWGDPGEGTVMLRQAARPDVRPQHALPVPEQSQANCARCSVVGGGIRPGRRSVYAHDSPGHYRATRIGEPIAASPENGGGGAIGRRRGPRFQQHSNRRPRPYLHAYWTTNRQARRTENLCKRLPRPRNKASKLIRQLLTFSRKQFIQMYPITVDETLAEI